MTRERIKRFTAILGPLMVVIGVGVYTFLSKKSPQREIPQEQEDPKPFAQLDLGMGDGLELVEIPSLDTVTDEQRAEEAKRLAEQVNRLSPDVLRYRARNYIAKGIDEVDNGNWFKARSAFKNAERILDRLEGSHEEKMILADLQKQLYPKLLEGMFEPDQLRDLWDSFGF